MNRHLPRVKVTADDNYEWECVCGYYLGYLWGRKARERWFAHLEDEGE